MSGEERQQYKQLIEEAFLSMVPVLFDSFIEIKSTIDELPDNCTIAQSARAVGVSDSVIKSYISRGILIPGYIPKATAKGLRRMIPKEQLKNLFINKITSQCLQEKA